MFTGAEPIIRENEWPFKGWRIGVTSGIGVDTVVLPPVNLSHAFIIEMPVSYKDISTETMVRIHEIIQMEKPANCQYYLKFAIDEGGGPKARRGGSLPTKVAELTGDGSSDSVSRRLWRTDHRPPLSSACGAFYERVTSLRAVS